MGLMRCFVFQREEECAGNAVSAFDAKQRVLAMWMHGLLVHSVSSIKRFKMMQPLMPVSFTNVKSIQRHSMTPNLKNKKT